MFSPSSNSLSKGKAETIFTYSYLERFRTHFEARMNVSRSAKCGYGEPDAVNA
jgi:hypothetical protein